MHLMFDEQAKTFAVILDKAEARALCNALTHATEPNDKKLNKRSKDYKVAKEISDELPVW